MNRGRPLGAVDEASPAMMWNVATPSTARPDIPLRAERTWPKNLFLACLLNGRPFNGINHRVQRQSQFPKAKIFF